MAEEKLSPELLRHKYWKEDKTQLEIAREIGVSRSQISNFMIEWHIPSRSATYNWESAS